MIIDKCLNSDSVKDIPVPRNMSGAEPTLAEPPVPLALARLQPRPHVRLPKGLRTQHRPSLPLASLKESMDESIVSRRKSEQVHLETDQDNNEIHESGYEIVDVPSPLKKNGSSRRASSSAVSERYTKILDLDTTVPSLYGRNSLPPRRASVAVSVPRADDKGRRRSWAAKLQLERKKRRKSGGEGTDEESEGSTPPSYTRQKRPSWWNVLVPDTILKNRSRRASQQLSRSAESIDQPHRRSKSRSVDHGFTAPFDLETLRSKVEGRFDAVHKDEDEPAKRLPPTPPIKTTTYTVCDRDTLTSVAARFDTTPSELTKLNRLATTFIFPGQSLLVPDKGQDGAKDADGSNDGGDTTSESTQGGPPGEQPEEKDILDTLRPVSPEAPSSPAAPQRFLKINVRHITDGQGVVSGVLLVTPNAVMFDPNVSDTLVMEHGPESYGVIAPMEFVVNAAIYYDIAHMRTHDSDPNAHKGEKPEIYYTNKTHSPGKDSLLVKDETFPELHGAGSAGDGDASGSECSYERGAVLTTEGVERGGDAFPKAFDRELVTPTSTQQTAEERRKSLLDHHWAIPSKERMSIDNASEVSSTTADIKEERGDSLDGSVSSGITQQQPAPELPSLHLVKLSCHDSGIDIRDPILNATPTNTKKVYSDADIVLSHDWVPPVSIAPAEAPLSAPPLGANEDRGSVVGARKPASVSFSLDGSSSANESMSKEDHVGGNKGEKKNKMLKRLSYPLSWMEGLTGDNAASQGSQADSLPTSADSHNSGSVFSKVFNRRSSLGGFGKSEPKKIVGSVPPRLDYRSMVSVDDMPALFVSFDKLIPRPARPSDDPPLYLRLRMGRPIGRTLPRTTPLMSYGRKRMKPEYWFGVPRNRVDDLFKFLNHWVPELYGELGDVTARGYQLIDSDTEWDDDEEGRNKSEKGERSGSQGDVGDLTRESWEVLSMSDELRRALYSSGASVDIEVSPPDLIGSTEILTMEHREKLCGVLPARAQGYMWSLVFSTSQNGFSLGSMYRKMQRVDSPVLLVIQDTDNNVFGALTSSALHPSEHFYGTGESLLFSFTPIQDESAPVTEVGKDEEDSKDSVFFAPGDFEKKPKENDVKTISTLEESQPAPPPAIKSKFQVWQWTGDNMYFIRGSNDNLSIGAGDGKFGLWLDGDLYLGRTQQCTTYGNEPLTTREDFIVKIMECWAFI